MIDFKRPAPPPPPPPRLLFGYYDNHSEPVPSKHIGIKALLEMAKSPTVATNGIHPAIATEEQRTALKAKAPLITPFNGNAKKKEVAKLAQFAACVVDHDHDNRSEAGIRQLYASLEVSYMAFTTSSHTDDAQRWKALVPYSRPCSEDEHLKIAKGIARYLKTDKNQANIQQGFYAPYKLTDDAPYACIDALDAYLPLDIDDVTHPFMVAAMSGYAELMEIEGAKQQPDNSDHNGDGAHPDWNGYTDDNELIEAARKMKPKGGRVFDTAWFADLFDGNTEALCRAFPADNDVGYDRSSADWKLACLFVFHAGRHPERIERLMRMSALQRPKWDRHDYLARTIDKAIHGATMFYDKDYKRPSEAPAVPVELSGWRDPVDLFSNTPVPPFPMECVPPAVRNYAEAISKASGFDAGAYAFSALITAAGHIKHSHRVQINDSYSQGAVLWGGVCDPSGGGKSAIMSASIAPLMAIDKQLAKQGMFKLSEWQANLEQAKKNGEPVPPRPVWQQRIISDTTTEAAGALLEGNDGLLLHADEITEFVGRMDAYSGASGKDRGVWLKSYDGEAVTINRAGRMPVHIPHFSVGIIAGMQPETLARLFNKSGGGAGSDGLFQRFLLYQVRQAVDADFSVVVGEPIKQSYIQLFSLIEGWNNSGFSANATVLDRDAVAAHQEYVNNVRKITARTSSPRFKEHLSKFQAFVIRLALVLHCLECAGRGQYSTQLTLETYNRAKRIMAVLYRHSEAAYLVLDDTLPATHDLMKSAAEAILSKKFAVVKMGDLTRDATGWRTADGRLKQAAIDGLLELDWLKDITPDHTGRGRPSLGLFAVNPKVAVLFSNQAERITRERAERYETIKEIAAAR